MSEQDKSIQEVLGRAGGLALETIARHTAVLVKGSTPSYCVFNNYISKEKPKETTIVIYSSASLLKDYRRGYDYPFIIFFKTLLLRQVYIFFYF